MYAQTPFPESAKSSRSPKIAKAQQTDIRTYFSPSPKNTPRTSPTNTPNPPPKTIMPPAARPKNHDSLFSEWKAPTYRPSSHKRSATADATLPSLTYNCNKALPNPRITSVIDASLLPPPLRLPTPSTSTCAKKEWKPRHRHQPSTTSIAEEGEGCVLMAAIDTRGAFRKSRVMALFDEQNLGIESALADPCGTASRESDEGEETVIYFRPEITPASPTNSKAESRPVVVEASQEENLSAKQTVNNVPKGHTRHSHKASKLLGGEEDTGQYLFPPFEPNTFPVHKALKTHQRAQSARSEPPRRKHTRNKSTQSTVAVERKARVVVERSHSIPADGEMIREKAGDRRKKQGKFGRIMDKYIL